MTTHQKMKNITIAVTDILVYNLEYLQEMGLIPSRSEGIRMAIREFLKQIPHQIDLFGMEVQP